MNYDQLLSPCFFQVDRPLSRFIGRTVGLQTLSRGGGDLSFGFSGTVGDQFGIWVCLKMLCTHFPNGFADHYPYEMAISLGIYPIFRQTQFGIYDTEDTQDSTWLLHGSIGFFYMFLWHSKLNRAPIYVKLFSALEW